MSLPLQFAILVIFILMAIWFVFYKPLLKNIRKFNRHIEKIKKEIGRDEDE